VCLLLVELQADRTLVFAADLVNLADVVRKLLCGGATVEALVSEGTSVDAVRLMVLAVLLKR